MDEPYQLLLNSLHYINIKLILDSEFSSVKFFNKLAMKVVSTNYAEQGYLLEDSADAELCQLAKEGYQVAATLVDAYSNIQHKWLHVSGKVKHLVNVHRDYPIFQKIIRNASILEKLQEIYGEQALFVTHSKLSFKVQGLEQVWFPHQDTAYKNHDSLLTTVAVFLEDCSEENGTLEFFPQSHKLGRLKHEIVFAKNETEPQIRVRSLPPLQPLPICGPQGGFTVFDGNMIHQSGENRRGGFRAIFIFEVEPIQKFALEADGREAIVLNSQKDFALTGWRKVVRQNSRYLAETKIKPILKKTMFFTYRIFFRDRFVDLTPNKTLSQP